MRPVSGSNGQEWKQEPFLGENKVLLCPEGDSSGMKLWMAMADAYWSWAIAAIWPPEQPKRLTQIFTAENIGPSDLASLEDPTQGCWARWIWLRFFLAFLPGCGGPG